MSKKNIILAAVLVALAGAGYLYRVTYHEWQAGADKADNFLAGSKFSDLDRIEIGRGTSTAALVKGVNGWLVEGGKGFPAAPEAIAAIESVLNDAFSSEAVLASDNPGKKTDYGTNENGVKVKLMKGGETAGEFIVGDLSREDYESTYISRADSDETILLRAGLANAFGREEWRDLNILSGSAETITRIRIQRGREETVIEKKDGEWQATKPKAADLSTEKVDELVRSLVRLRAAGVPEQKFAGTGLEKNGLIIQATGEGADLTVMFGDKTGGGWYAKPGDRDLIYLVSDGTKTALDKKIDDLK